MRKGEVVGHVDPETLKPIPKPQLSSYWFLFTVMAMSEARLAEKIGDAAYYPRRKIVSKRRGRLGLNASRYNEKFIPVIPGYLFYNGLLEDPGIQWLFDDKAFIGIVTESRGFEDAAKMEPARVPNVAIHKMRMAELAGSAEVLEVFSVIVGEVVEIVAGKYAGKTVVVSDLEFGRATLDFAGSRERAKISVSELGKISFKP